MGSCVDQDFVKRLVGEQCAELFHGIVTSGRPIEIDHLNFPAAAEVDDELVVAHGKFVGIAFDQRVDAVLGCLKFGAEPAVCKDGADARRGSCRIGLVQCPVDIRSPSDSIARRGAKCEARVCRELQRLAKLTRRTDYEEPAIGGNLDVRDAQRVRCARYQLVVGQLMKPCVDGFVNVTELAQLEFLIRAAHQHPRTAVERRELCRGDLEVSLARLKTLDELGRWPNSRQIDGLELGRLTFSHSRENLAEMGKANLISLIVDHRRSQGEKSPQVFSPGVERRDFVVLGQRVLERAEAGRQRDAMLRGTVGEHRTEFRSKPQNEHLPQPLPGLLAAAGFHGFEQLFVVGNGTCLRFVALPVVGRKLLWIAHVREGALPDDQTVDAVSLQATEILMKTVCRNGPKSIGVFIPVNVDDVVDQVRDVRNRTLRRGDADLECLRSECVFVVGQANF